MLLQLRPTHIVKSISAIKLRRDPESEYHGSDDPEYSSPPMPGSIQEVDGHDDLGGGCYNDPNTASKTDFGEEFVVMALYTPYDHGDEDGHFHHHIKCSYKSWLVN
jgi:hypothetical protein